MNAWSTLSVAILLALAAIAGVPASAQEGEQGEEPGESQGSHNATGSGNNGNGGNSGDAQARRECQQRYNSGDQNVSDPEHPCHRYYVQSGNGSSDNRGKSERLARYQSDYEQVHKPRQADGREDKLPNALGFRVEPDGYQGRHVFFVPNLDDQIVSDVMVGDLVVIDSIETPGPVTDDPRLGSNDFRAEGDDWDLRITDHPRGHIKFDTDEDSGPFVITFPQDAVVEWHEGRVAITYPATSGRPDIAVLAGDLEPYTALAANNTTEDAKILVVGNANYILPSRGSPGQGNFGASYDNAILNGTVGAEMKVQRAAGSSQVHAETTTFGDMDIMFESSDDTTIEGSPDRLYTITVDSPTHEGKTIAVSIESGLVDPSSLVFRYFNVNDNETVQASIVQASDLEDVLDPLNDGVVAEYWVVEDVNGVHALISIPHFSIHKIEMQSLGQVIIEQPSIVLGVLGAILVVGVATRAMFRRPRE